MARFCDSNQKRGVTLVELIVVLVILAVLAALLVPSLTGYIDKAVEKRIMLQARSLMTAASRRLPIFTRRFQRTILGTSELNFCVRNGNRWNLTVIVTDQYDWFSITFLFYFVQCFLKDVPSKLNNHCSHFIIDLRIQANCGQALDLLVHTC